MENNFQRLFFIFKNMDVGFGTPTGFVKVEINGGTSKIQLSLSNVMDRRDMRYKLYGIYKQGSQLRYTDICNIPVINGRADIKVNYDNGKIGSNYLDIVDINIYAVIILLNDREPSVVCPLVAYTSIMIDWKDQFDKLLISELKGEKEKAETQILSGIDIEAPALVETPALSTPVPSMPAQDNQPELQVENEEILENSPEPKMVQEDDIFDEHCEGGHPDIQLVEPEDSKTEKEVDEIQADIPNTVNVEDNTEHDQQENDEVVDFPDVDAENVIEDNQDYMEPENTIIESIEEEFNNSAPSGNNAGAPSLKEDLDNSFEKYNPFKMKSKRFKWWKINSPGYLNNILFRNNIKTYLLFSPSVMLAHYKYKYIIFGIRTSRYAVKESLICGVPGVYGIDENPFSGVGSWIQLEGYKPKYGAFGYWMVMIDAKSGKLIKIQS